MEDVLKRTCDLEFGVLNPPISNDIKPTYNAIETDSQVVQAQVAHDIAFKESSIPSRRYKACVMRVDSDLVGAVRVKARVPEEDGAGMTEPVEFVPRDVESNSHFCIDGHRDYEWDGQAPQIGQEIWVAIPADRSRHTPGEILGLTNNMFYGSRLKSSPLQDKSAETDSGAESFCHALGDSIGGGDMNPGNGVAPTCEDTVTQLAGGADVEIV